LRTGAAVRAVIPSGVMLVRAARLASISLLATLACRPESAPSEQPTPEPTQASIETPQPVPEPEEVGPEPEEAEPKVDATEPEETGAPVDGEGVPGGLPPAESEPVATAEPKQRDPLPKAIHKPGNGKCVQKFAVGEKVKSFKLPSLAGDKSISPGGYRNRVVLLNFWALWCKPCLAELPEFDRLYRKYRSHGFTLVAVTTDEDPKPVQAFVDEHKLVAKVALEGEEAAAAYDRPQFPFSFVIDGNGTIVASFEYVSDACLGDLEQVIRDSLEQLE
jgi:thiol-disulfide isomerase/thioredoxin